MASRILLSPLGLYGLLGFANAPWRLGLKCLLGSVASQAPPHRLSGSRALGLCYCLLGSIASPALLPSTRLYRPLDSAITSQAPPPLGLCYQAMLSPLGLYHLSGLAIASRSLSPLRLCYRLQALLPLGLCHCPLGPCPPTDQVTPNELPSAYQAARRARPTGTIGGSRHGELPRLSKHSIP
jgi:hypothetical protein